MKYKTILLVQLSLLLALCISCSETKKANPYDSLRLNEIQMIGSHNSYKIAIEPELWKYLLAQDSMKAIKLQYSHVSMVQQLELGLRNLEIDVFHDPAGGLFKNPQGLSILKEKGITPQEFDKENKLDQPGMKVFHIQEIDFRSHHLLFKDCLSAMKKWSDNNPKHLPVIITLNTKDKKIEGFREPSPFLKNAIDSVDIEIRNVLPEEKLITPDFIRGDHKTLADAITKHGWPKISKLRGRFLFVLDQSGDKLKRYLDGHKNLENRVMFVNVKPGNPNAAFMIVNKPGRDKKRIQKLVKKGFLVRTRSDASTFQARNNSYKRFEAAKSSGAQVITTDYYLPSALFSSTYKVVFDSVYVRKNPFFSKVE